jgi:hypothetical protein
MGYLERYIAGENEQVWTELQALGEAVRQEPAYEQARAVAGETMERVRRNCERIVNRLRSLGCQFGRYPDGRDRSFTFGPLRPPDGDSEGDLRRLEQAVGPLPISLVAFWQQVGSVDLVGWLPGWPTSLDPLVVERPATGVSELADMEFQLETHGHFEASLAPDVFHKHNVSGGAPYAVKLPDPAADFILRNEPHGVLFVQYLRLAILRFGGFPGLEGRTEELSVLPTLLEGLEPF